MALSLDRDKLLYAVGILLGIIAIFYFGFELLEDLSPATTALLLVLGFLVFLLAGVGLAAAPLDLVSYALASGWYLAFVAYTLSAFDLGDGGTILLLAGSAALFIGLGNLASRDRLALTRQQALIGVAVCLALGVGLIGVDVVGPQATHTAEFEDSIDVPEPRERVQVGTVTVENEFVLPRSVDVPRYYACTPVTTTRPLPVQYEDRLSGTLLGGGETVSSTLLLDSRAFYEEEELHEAFRDVDAVPVETADRCPEDFDDGRVLVVTSPE